MNRTYDPNSEVTNENKVVAGHWECQRRNKKFREQTGLWLQSEGSQRAHALSAGYLDMQHHTARCAWDWMLTAEQRFRLAKYQIEKQCWFFDSDYNFGPIISRKNFSPAAMTGKNWREFIQVEPLPNPPPPITVDQSWDQTPNEFKEQFRVAYASNNEFGQINNRLAEFVMPLRLAAAKLAAGDKLHEAAVIAQFLFDLASELRDLTEFSNVFKIPKRRYSEKQFQVHLDTIRQTFKLSKLLVPTKTFDRHESYQGTEQDWRWFLEAERLGLDIRKSADCYELAKIYSEDLRQRAMRGKTPRRANAPGFSGTKFSSKAITNRRITLKRHVKAIEKWIAAAYPPRKSAAEL